MFYPGTMDISEITSFFHGPIALHLIDLVPATPTTIRGTNASI